MEVGSKPFQVLPMIEAGGIEKFGFDDEEIAVMTASHGGEEKHVERVRNIFDKMAELEALDCGRRLRCMAGGKRLIEKKENMDRYIIPAPVNTAA